jgi:YHS domain-containing protein
MIRVFFVEFVFPLLLFLLLRVLLGNFFKNMRTGVARRQVPQPPPSQPATELRKDPVCGAYVAAAVSVTRTINGRVTYFCSRECADAASKG